MGFDSVNKSPYLVCIAVVVLVSSVVGSAHGVSQFGEGYGSINQSSNNFDSNGSLTGKSLMHEQANSSLEIAAREGAEAGLQELMRRGISPNSERRQAAIEAAVTGTNSVGQFSLSNFTSGDNDSPVAEEAVPPEMIRAAAYGAVFGTLLHTEGSTISTDNIRSNVIGAVLGSLTGRIETVKAGGQISPDSVRAGAQGAAEGTIYQTIVLTPPQSTSTIETDTILVASAGSATGSVFAAGLLPIYGEDVTPEQVSNTALGSAAGAVHGTYSESGTDLPRTSNETLAVAVGSSAGVVLSLLHTHQISPDEMRETAYYVAIDALTDPQIATNEQILEATVVTAAERFTNDRAPDPFFPEPIVLSTEETILPLVFSPRDPDGDGRYEDVNGNGILSYSDVVALSAIFSSDRRLALSAEQNLALDFNRDCVFDQRDVWALDDEITGGPYQNQPEPPISGINNSAGYC